MTCKIIDNLYIKDIHTVLDADEIDEFSYTVFNDLFQYIDSLNVSYFSLTNLIYFNSSNDNRTLFTMNKNFKQIESDNSIFYEFLSEKYNIQCFDKVNKLVGNKIYNKYFPVEIISGKYIYRFNSNEPNKPIQYHYSKLIDDIYLNYVDKTLLKKDDEYSFALDYIIGRNVYNEHYTPIETIQSNNISNVLIGLDDLNDFEQSL